MTVEGGAWDLVAQSPHSTGRRWALHRACPHTSLSHGSLQTLQVMPHSMAA